MRLLLIGNFLMRLGVHFVERVAGIVIVPILISKIGVEGYGYYGLANGIILLFVNIICLRFTMAMIRFYPGPRAEAGQVIVAGLLYWLGFASVTALAVAVAPAQIASLAFADPDKVRLLLLAVGVGLLTTFYEFVTATLRAENRLVLLSGVDTGERILFVAGCLALFAWGHASVENVLWVLLAGTALRIAVAVFPAMRGMRFRVPECALFRSMIVFCLPFLPYLASVWFIERSPFFVVARQLDHAATGILMLAFTLASILAAVTSPLQTTLYPMLSRAFDDGRMDDVREYMSIAVRITLSACVFGTLALVIGTRPLLTLLNIEAATPSRLLGATLCLAVTLGAVRQLVINLLHIEKKTAALVWVGALGAAVAAVASMILLSPWGLVGAAAGMALGTAAQVLAMYRRASAHLMSLPSGRYLLALAVSALLALGLQVVAVRAGEWIWLGSVVLSGMAFIAGLYLFGGVSGAEKHALRLRMATWFPTVQAKD